MIFLVWNLVTDAITVILAMKVDKKAAQVVDEVLMTDNKIVFCSCHKQNIKYFYLIILNKVSDYKEIEKNKKKCILLNIQYKGWILWNINMS